MHHYCDGVKSHGKLDRIEPVGLGRFQLYALHAARGIGDIDRTVDHRGNAGAGSPAGHRDAHLVVERHIVLCPGQRQVDKRIRSLVLYNHCFKTAG